MREIALGVDIGTSLTKVAACDAVGEVVYTRGISSPGSTVNMGECFIPVHLWLTRLSEIVKSLINDGDGRDVRVVSICISAIAPTLVIFDATRPADGYAIPYSFVPPGVRDSKPSQCDQRLTACRVQMLRELGLRKQFTRPCITDLVGYINWYLTGELTVNCVSLVEMGLNSAAGDCNRLTARTGSAPRVVAVAERIGETCERAMEFGLRRGIPVCGGCPDTLGSVVGAGLKHRFEEMLYLGTFGSFMSLTCDVDQLLDSRSCSASPFRWLLSVPGLGPKLESLGREWFGSDGDMADMDRAASSAGLGAEGALFLLPRWKNGMNEIGTFAFCPGLDGEIGGHSRKARAALEGIGYAILALTGSFAPTLKVSGGGARSECWRETLAAVLGVDIGAQSMSWEAVGTADIAARLVWKHTITRLCHWSKTTQDVHIGLIRDNARRAKKLYQASGWI